MAAGLRTFGGSPTQIGGWFSLTNTEPPLSFSTARAADTGVVSAPVFLARVNGTAKVQVDVLGNVVVGSKGRWPRPRRTASCTCRP